MNSDCEKYERLISDRLDGVISPEDERIIREHLEQCADCRSFEESSRSHRDRLRALPEVLPDAPMHGAAKGSRTSRSRWTRRISMPLPVAAVLALVALTGWTWALLPGPRSGGQQSLQPVPAHSVEIIRVEPVQAVKSDAGRGDSTGKKEGEV